MLNEFNNLIINIKEYIKHGKENKLKEIKESYNNLQEKLKSYGFKSQKSLIRKVLDESIKELNLNAEIKERKGENLEMRITRAILEPPTENHLNDLLKYEIKVESSEEDIRNLAYKILEKFKSYNIYGFRVDPDKEGQIYLLDVNKKEEFIIRKNKWKEGFWPPELLEVVNQSKYIIAQLNSIKEPLETFLEDYYKSRIDDLLPETERRGAKYKAIHLELALKENNDFIPFQIQLYTKKDLKEIYEKLPYEVYLEMRENHLKFLLNKQYNNEEKERIRKLAETLDLSYLKRLLVE